MFNLDKMLFGKQIYWRVGKSRIGQGKKCLDDLLYYFISIGAIYKFSL